MPPRGRSFTFFFRLLLHDYYLYAALYGESMKISLNINGLRRSAFEVPRGDHGVDDHSVPHEDGIKKATPIQRCV